MKTDCPPSTAFHHFKHLLSTSSGRPDYLAHRYRRRRQPQERTRNSWYFYALLSLLSLTILFRSHSPALAATDVADIELASNLKRITVGQVRGLASLCFFADPIYALVSPSNPAFLQRHFLLTLASVQPLARKHLRHDDAWNVHEEDGMGGGEAERTKGARGDRSRRVPRPVFFFFISSHPFPRPALIPALSLIVVLSRTPPHNPIPVVESIGLSPRRAGADGCRCRIHTYPVVRAAGEVPRDGSARTRFCAARHLRPLYRIPRRLSSPHPHRTAPPRHTRAHPGTGCQVPSVWNLRTRMPLLSPFPEHTAAMHAGRVCADSFLRRHPPRLRADSALLHIPELRPVSSSALPSPYPCLNGAGKGYGNSTYGGAEEAWSRQSKEGGTYSLSTSQKALSHLVFSQHTWVKR
ncbi:hypothetical protein C8F04DRAFT_1192891 [Mycena alexandri]|uniref:Uncharacterized protein n=1 Tax=Mycena alexandri TaxID=1745969 RepID=A0AAD6SA46_9AGAR|nr:hypothetical protein C8F04DRAFT_1192891 [Mycena alexandri]